MRALTMLALLISLPLIGAIEARPTFVSCGIYIPSEPGTCRLRFRTAGGAWRTALPLWYSTADQMFRGSILNLDEGTAYEAEAAIDRSGVVETQSVFFTTWATAVPVKKTIPLKDIVQNGAAVIEERGSADGWIVYDGSGFVLSNKNDADATVLISGAEYVIIDNVTIRGVATRHGFEVRNSRQVRILRADVSHWGRTGTYRYEKGGKYFNEKNEIINNDAAVFINLSENVVVERCFFHDPTLTSNPWDADNPAGLANTHPTGPNGLYVRSRGGIVSRFNDIIGSDDHRWNDAQEGWGNGDPEGGFFRDSDIYGNMLAFGNDDATELDGGQMNVRFFRNKSEQCLTGVCIAPNLKGPSYLFRNLVVNLGDIFGNAGTVIKSGGGTTYSKGVTFIYNNTYCTAGSGIGGGGYGSDKDRAGYNAVSRNNIIVSRNGQSTIYDPAKWANDFDNDLLYGGGIQAKDGVAQNAIIGKPQFRDMRGGDLRLDPNSIGAGKSAAVATIAEAGSDLGAYEADSLIPYRPIPVRADRYQVDLRAEVGDTTARAGTVAASVIGAPGYAKRFRILKNDSFSWMSVSPADGTVSASSPVTFTVGLDMKEVKKAGIYKGIFLIKLEDGYSIPVSVYASVADRRTQIIIDAEDGEIKAPFAIVQESDAAGGSCIFVAPSIPSQSSANADASMFPFEIKEAGAYYLSLRIRSIEQISMHDSCFIAVDGGEWKRVDLQSAEDWVWSPVRQFGKTISLDAGKHTIRIAHRENGLYIDRIGIGKEPVLY